MWVGRRENHMDWTAEAIDQLRAFWAEGHSTAEIGRRMGISKNAVVGKAHRLNLPARPSPIRREAEGDAAPRPVPQPRRLPGATPRRRAAGAGGRAAPPAGSLGPGRRPGGRRAAAAGHGGAALPARLRPQLLLAAG